MTTQNNSLVSMVKLSLSPKLNDSSIIISGGGVSKTKWLVDGLISGI